MKNKSDSPISVQEQAAYWFTLLRTGTLTAQQQDVFEAWRCQDPKHEAELQALQRVWSISQLIPENELRQMLPVATSKRNTRRQMGYLVASLTSVAALGMWSLYRYQSGRSDFVAEYFTHNAEHRQETLPDGSVIDLNRGTQLSVHFFKNARVVDLRAGEAIFRVASDKVRPFTVRAGSTQVRVTGTEFVMRHETNFTDVSVLSGRVQVATGRWLPNRLVLVANQGTKISAQQASYLESRETDRLMAWREGKVIFKNQVLVEVIAEMNRYLPTSLYLADSRLRDQRISGVFTIADDQSFLRMLNHVVPIEIEYLADGRIAIRLKNKL